MTTVSDDEDGGKQERRALLQIVDGFCYFDDTCSVNEVMQRQKGQTALLTLHFKM